MKHWRESRDISNSAGLWEWVLMGGERIGKERQKAALRSWSVWWGEGGISLLGGKSTERMWRRKWKQNLADFKKPAVRGIHHVSGAELSRSQELSCAVLKRDPPRWGCVWLLLHRWGNRELLKVTQGLNGWDLNTRSSTRGLELVITSSSLWSVCAAAFAWSSMCLLVYQINACLLCGKSSLKLIRFSQNPRMTQIPPSFFLLWEVFITLSSWPWYRVLNLWMSWVLLTSSKVHSPFSKQCIE